MANKLRLTTVVAYSRDLIRSRVFYEGTLGFRVIEASDRTVRYSAGAVDLELRAAQQDGVQLVEGHDETSLMVFLVDDVDQMREALERRSVRLDPTLRYEIGATAAFYDPDGHSLTIYEPSAEAMTWPSAAKIREILARAETRRAAGEPPGGSRIAVRGQSLGECPMVYLFLFVGNPDQARAFYHATLRLPIIEDDPDAGVVKYDVGGLLLATHMVGGDAFCAVEMDLSREKGVAPVFEVAGEAPDLRAWRSRTVRRAADGRTAVVSQDPNGHHIWLTPARDVVDGPPRASANRG